MQSLASLEDRALIEGALAGRSECFGVLLHRHTAAVRRRIRSMVRNSWDEDELVQETFLKVWRHLSAFRSDASFRTWITRVATNEALQRMRRERGSLACSTDFDLDRCPSAGESPQDELLRDEERREVRNAIAKIPERYRKVLVLRDLHDLTTREAARRLHYGLPLVKTRLFRARRMLCEAIRQNAAR